MTLAQLLPLLTAAVETAASSWQGLDWHTDGPPTVDELEEVAADAASAAEEGRQALEYLAELLAAPRAASGLDGTDSAWRETGLDRALGCLEAASRLERHYGDDPYWSVPRELLERFLAVRQARLAAAAEEGRLLYVYVQR